MSSCRITTPPWKTNNRLFSPEVFPVFQANEASLNRQNHLDLRIKWAPWRIMPSMTSAVPSGVQWVFGFPGFIPIFLFGFCGLRRGQFLHPFLLEQFTSIIRPFMENLPSYFFNISLCRCWNISTPCQKHSVPGAYSGGMPSVNKQTSISAIPVNSPFSKASTAAKVGMISRWARVPGDAMNQPLVKVPGGP